MSACKVHKFANRLIIPCYFFKYCVISIYNDDIDEKVSEEEIRKAKEEAIKKAKDEYKKYQVKTISPVEKEYLETLKVISNKIDYKTKNE